MKIIHVTNNSEKATLGTERQVVYLAIAQKARGSDVSIMIDRPGVFTDACAQYGIPVVTADVLDSSVSLLSAGENTVQSLISQFRSLNASLIHCHTEHVASQAIPAANLEGIPCLFNAYNMKHILAARAMGLQFVSICPSRTGFERLKNVPGEEPFYIPNGTCAAPAAGAGRTETTRSPSLIFVGSLITRKGADIAIMTMAELRRRRGQDCPRLDIYGDGDQRAYLTEMVAVLGLQDAVRFHGFQLDILGNCPSTDILLVPSYREVGPLVVLEAMSRGMPIVATDVGDVPQMLPDPRHGRVIPPASIMALADSIESLLADIADGQFDPELLIERHHLLYSADKMAERMEAVYGQLLPDTSLAGRAR
jgi:glycosyltransferase involved in cell wall biosynthesis